jgi:hypothetical protein
VDAKPGFLKKIIGIGAAGRIRKEKAIEQWAQPIDQSRGRGEIAALIAGHQQLQVAVRVHDWDTNNRVFVQTASRHQVRAGTSVPSHR